MRAHAIYKYPRCIFQGKHLGKKVSVVPLPSNPFCLDLRMFAYQQRNIFPEKIFGQLNLQKITFH